jgi:homoserine kinase
MNAVRAFAPGTMANVGPGLDILGLALEGPGDTVRVARSAGPGVTVEDSGHPDIPRDAAKNTAGIAASHVLARAGEPRTGLAIRVVKGLPLSGGQGGSAASAAAAAVAVNALLGSPLAKADLLDACLAAEEAVAGRHADNAAAALFGGVVLVRSLDPLDVVQLRFPEDLLVVLVLPEQRLRTQVSRAALPRSVDRGVALAQAANVGALVAALARGDHDLLRRSIQDGIAEPARSKLLPGFPEAKAAALEAGALGCSISGAGPSAFAFAASEESGRVIADAMVAAYRGRGIAASARVCSIDARGARVLEAPE